MRHQKLRADGERALDFAAKRGNGSRAQRFVAGGEIDEVIVVDDQREKIVPFARPVEQLHFTFRPDSGTPLARAGRKNLEGVRAGLGGGERRVLEGFADGSVNAETQRQL